jgi:hypothetical protein
MSLHDLLQGQLYLFLPFYIRQWDVTLCSLVDYYLPHLHVTLKMNSANFSETFVNIY